MTAAVFPVWRWFDPIEASLAAQGLDDPLADSLRRLLTIVRFGIGSLALVFLMGSFVSRRAEGRGRLSILQILGALSLLPWTYLLFRFCGLPVAGWVLRRLFLPADAP